MKWSQSLLMAAVFAVPLQKDKWTELKYNKIPANKVTDEMSGLKLSVQASASPLIFKLEDSLRITRIRAEIVADGLVRTIKESAKWSEDSGFRLGLVATGSRRLGWFQRQLAADWVLKLFSLAPADTGLDKIYFFNVGVAPEKIGWKRDHPKSDLLSEEIVSMQTKDKENLIVQKHFDKPLSTAALWVSSDGDDTKSEFSIRIQKIEIEYEK